MVSLQMYQKMIKLASELWDSLIKGFNGLVPWNFPALATTTAFLVFSGMFSKDNYEQYNNRLHVYPLVAP